MEVTTEELRTLKELVLRKTGIEIDEQKLFGRLKKKIEKLMKEENLKSFSEFAAEIENGKAGLLDKLIDLVTVNETYFLRESYQFETLIKYILPELLEKKGVVKILSAPCASGEEVYSIAICILEFLESLDGIFITGIDISPSMIEKARKGIYNLRSIHKIPQQLLLKYFEKMDENHYRVKETLKKNVSFYVTNVLDRNEILKFKGTDILFSRNMLIYFDEESKEKAVRNFHDILNKGGYLFLGHAEKVPKRLEHLFEKRKLGESFVYIAV